MAIRGELSNIDDRANIAGAGAGGVYLVIWLSHRRWRADVLAAEDGPRTESMWWRRVGLVLAMTGFAQVMARYDAVPRGVARILMGVGAGLLQAFMISHGYWELRRLGYAGPPPQRDKLPVARADDIRNRSARLRR